MASFVTKPLNGLAAQQVTKEDFNNAVKAIRLLAHEYVHCQNAITIRTLSRIWLTHLENNQHVRDVVVTTNAAFDNKVAHFFDKGVWE